MAHKKQVGVLADNRKARFDYDIDTTYEAGIVLLGSEIKALRSGKGQISDAYITVDKGEIWVQNFHIATYENDAFALEYNPIRPRKLLLNQREIERIVLQIKRDNYSAIPLRVYVKKHLAKVLVGLGQGKRRYQKRDLLRKKAETMDVERVLKRRKY